MFDNLIFYNSHDEYFKNPFGAVTCNKSINMKLRISKNIAPERVLLRLWYDEGREEKIEMKLLQEDGENNIYKVEFNTPEAPGLIWYYFIIRLHNINLYYGNNTKKTGGIGSVNEYPPDSYQLTVYKTASNTPVWFSECIMYQIFIDRFYNGMKNDQVLNPREDVLVRKNWEESPEYIRNPEGGVIQYDFFGGNLLGIIKKLRYLRSLQVGVIYLNPIFEAPSNHKYDTADYKNIDRMFGDIETFKLLCAEAEANGIKIILDGVFSHTGSDSIYFNRSGNYPGIGAYQSMDSPYYSWYRFKKYPDEYESWWGIGTLPNVNELDKSYEDFILFKEDSVIKKWIKLGAKGWRLDVADELPDQFIKHISKEMKRVDSESILIGEVWEDASNKSSYGVRREYLLGEELDSVMNYPLREIMLDFILERQSSVDTADRLMQLYENYPINSFYLNMNLIGSHDVPRILTLLGEAPDETQMSMEEKKSYRLNDYKKAIAIKRLKILSLIQMTFPGVPCIYYGDEAGVEGFRDPLNRRTFPWGNENIELLNWYRLITALRNKYDVLKTGTWHPLCPQEDVFGYIRDIQCEDVFGRKMKNNIAAILVNRSMNTSQKVDLYIEGGDIFRLYDLLHENKSYEVIEGRLNIEIQPLDYILLIMKRGL